MCVPPPGQKPSGVGATPEGQCAVDMLNYLAVRAFFGNVNAAPKSPVFPRKGLEVASGVHHGDVHGNALGCRFDQGGVDDALGFGQGQVVG